MKAKNIILIVGFLCISLSSNAQTYWRYGGDNVFSLQYFGTTSGYPLPFITNNSEKARILTTGEFGLGTTTPSNWLHIVTNASGTVNAKETFRTDVPASTESNWRMYRGTVNMFRLWHGTSGNDIFIQSLRGGLKLSSGNTGTTVSAMEIVGGTASTSDGNVMIGDFSTYSPSARLHIKGNGYAKLFKVEQSA